MFIKKFGNIRKWTVLFIVVALLFTSGVTGLGAEEKKQEDPNMRYLNAIKQYILDHYKMDVTEAELFEGAVRGVIEEHPELLNKAVEGMLNSLDEHSTYFSEEDYDDFSSEVDGQFGGIGITVNKKGEYITIVAPLENTPGERAGLKSGDKIIYVNGQDVTNKDIDLVLPLMRGEPGTSVQLGIKRDGVDQILYFDIVRELIKVNPITHKVLEDNIGYIQIQTFNANTNEYITKALEEFDAQGITDLIIDIRYNTGGSLYQVVEVAKHFVPKGPIVSIEYKDPNRNETFYSDLEKTKYNLVVLVNEWSASASEILAGAIQDTKAGKIVGVTTYGKGTVQELLPLKKGGAMKLTIARYLTPSGKAIHGIGIQPDVEVKNKTRKLDVSTLEKLEVSRKITLNDTGKDVLAAEQRLNILGYDVGEPDEVFDEKTCEAVKSFQRDNNLFPYGVLDITTQIYLDNAMLDVEITEDEQLKTAIEILKSKDSTSDGSI